MNNKGYLQISFGWLFAIIVGAVIIFLAIFLVGKMINTEGKIQSAKTSKEIGILLNPLETGFESATSTSVFLPDESIIYNECNNIGSFGTQGIEVKQREVGNKWSVTTKSSFQNKYILSERNIQGKTFYIFSKPFEFPFKVADLMYITPASVNYCFIKKDIPDNIENEISNLNQLNLKLEGTCSEEDTKVCFDDDDCEIYIDYEVGYVEKQGERMYFETDTLMYAAIFSDNAVYECQLKRLMQRIEQLSNIYMDKENFIALKCDSNLGMELLSLSSSASNLENSQTINTVYSDAQTLEYQNKGSCKLW